ncbi:hypothetical protein BDZ94DRAFT_1249522 [Collybia nuda]|uniref:F-box domain-containing protein n=1 Tax=Collybia nuda TaxID=64659 RepID=A0A9P5YBH6_9AGAR|nr:hypothetical protein BDZ94DRAFT_1249522 [Collybia nuda]
MSSEELSAYCGLTNENLSDIDVAIVRGLLRDALTELDQIELQLPLQDSDIPLSLKEQHANTLAQVERFRVAIAPFKKLPPEILIEIFVLCIPPIGVVFPPDYKSVPWSIGRVCSSWRHLVFTEPQIWLRAQLLYQFRAVHRDSLNTFIHSVMRYRRLISLQAVVSPKNEISFNEFIAQHSATLEELLISLRSPSSAPFLSLRSIKFKHLKSLVIRLPPGIRNQLSPIMVFSNTPRLCKFEVQTSSGQYIPFRNFPIQLRFGQITELVFTCLEFTPYQFCYFLRHCTALVQGTFRLAGGPPPHLIPSNIIVPSLRTVVFHLANYGLSLRENFLSFLTAPLLESLTLLSASRTKWPYDAIRSLVERSSCVLQFFEAGFPIDDQGVTSLFRGVPTLREIKLPLYTPISDKVIGAIIDENLVPELEIFHFGTASIDTAIDLIIDRWSVNEENGGPPRGIWEAVIGYGSSVEDLSEGLMRYSSYEKRWLWDEERMIQLKYMGST